MRLLLAVSRVSPPAVRAAEFTRSPLLRERFVPRGGCLRAPPPGVVVLARDLHLADKSLGLRATDLPA